LGYCDAACTLLDVLPVPTFETSPSFGAFFIQEMIKADVVSTGWFIKSFTILKVYVNLFRGYTQGFELS
jgi:hypothetical protein